MSNIFCWTTKKMRKFSKLFSGISGLVLAAMAFGAGAAALNHVESFAPAKADGATEAGQFRIKDIATVNLWSNGNEFVFLWVEGVNGTTLDYPDVDGEASDPTTVDQSYVEGIGGYGDFTVDGQVRGTIAGQTIINMWTRHQVYAFMPEQMGPASTIDFKAGFRIPTYTYVKGGAASYYTLAEDTFGHRQLDTHAVDTIETWSIGNVKADNLITAEPLIYNYRSSSLYNDIQINIDLGCNFFGNVSYPNGGTFDPKDADPIGVAPEVYMNDHLSQFRRKEAHPEGGDNRTHIDKGIVIGDKTLEEWIAYDITAEECHGTPWPAPDSGMISIYRPMIVKVLRNGDALTSPQKLEIHINRSLVSIMDAKITLKAEYFYGWNPTDGKYYGLENDVVLTPDFVLDGSQPDIVANKVILSKNAQIETFDETFDLNNSNYVENENNGKTIRVNFYTDMPINASIYTQTWCVDHCEFVLDSILVNGVKASVINGMQTRDGRQVYGSDFDAGSPIANNDNFSRSVLVELKKHGTNNGLIRFSVYVSKAALAAYTPSSTLETITLAKNFTWINADNKVSRLTSDKTLHLLAGRLSESEINEYTISDSTFFIGPDGEGRLVLFAEGNAKWGFNLSDKDPYKYNLEHIFINGKSIAQINTDFAANIELSEYNFDPFNAYTPGQTPTSASPLTKPVITWSGHDEGTNKDVIHIIMHPKYVAHLVGASINVKYESGIACMSDSYVGYKYVGADYVATVRNGLGEASIDDLPADSIIRNIGGWNPGHTKNAVKEFDQTIDSLLYRFDTNGNAGLYFTNNNPNTHGEFRLYFPGNGYKSETKGYAMTTLTFDYMYQNAGTVEESPLNHTLTADGYYVPYDGVTKGSANLTMQALIKYAKDDNMYHDYEIELINDGQLHTATLNLAYSEVMGFAWQLWNFSGTFLLSNVQVDYQEYNANLEALVGDKLKMYAYTGDGQCASYYADAKAAYLALSADEKALFNSFAGYGSAKARLTAWAAANGETFDAAAGTFTPNGAGALFGIVSKSNATIIIVVATALTMISALGVGLMIRRRRLAK